MLDRENNIGRPPLFKNTPCIVCGKYETYIYKNGVEKWHTNIDPKGRICHKCYQTSGYFKKIRKPWSKRSSKKRITFMYQRIYIDFNPRKGVCSQCGKQGLTDLHHDEYDIDNLLSNTRELCKSCHSYETWKQRKDKDKI